MIMFWVAVLAIGILLYVLLDGFDLGVGILFGMARDDGRRATMLSAVSPVWDGNETWLVVTAVVLWGAFPPVYAALLSAFYLPLLLMLTGLILRGVAFEYRHQAEGSRWIWDIAFAGGSLVVTFIQGMTVGALVEGLQIADGQYTGGEFDWLSPFSLLCGVGLCLGYALLGACWLVKKTEGETRDEAYCLIPFLATGLLAFLFAVFTYALAAHLQVMNRWLERPYLLVFPIIGAAAAGGLAYSVRHRRDRVPFRIADLRRGLRDARHLVLALHDPVLDHDRGRGSTTRESCLHVLGRRALRLPADADLRCRQLQRLPGQDPIVGGTLPMTKLD